MNILKKKLPIILFLLLLINISTAFAAVQPALSLLQTEMYANSNMLLLAKVDIDAGDAVQADVYIRATLPDGSDYYLTGQNTFLEDPHAIVKNWKVSKLRDFKVLSMILPDSLPKGAYSWEVLFLKPGGKIGIAADLIVEHKLDFALKEQPEEEKKLIGFTSDRGTYSAGEKMKLFIEADPAGASKTFDLYVSLIDSEGKKSDLGPDLKLTDKTSRPTPVVKDFNLSSRVDKFQILELELPEGTKPGTYTWRIIAVEPGKDPALAANHVFADEIFAGIIDPGNVVDLSRCPALSAVGACSPDYMPRKAYVTTQQDPLNPSRTLSFHHDEYDPCNYDLTETQMDLMVLVCAFKIQDCRNDDAPTLSKCADTSYMFSGCGSVLANDCENIVENVCPGADKSSCENVLLNNTVANQCEFNSVFPDLPDLKILDSMAVTEAEAIENSPGLANLRAFGDACYANFCENEPDLEKCLSFEIVMGDYCATGTPAAPPPSDPADVVVPTSRTLDAADAGDAEVLLVDPYFADRFKESCEPVIDKRIKLCEDLRRNQASLVTKRSSVVEYYSHYIKPFIAYDPLEEDAVFYPPEEYELCSITPEFPVPRGTDLLPLFTQYLFESYHEVIRNTQMLDVFDALEANIGLYDTAFPALLEANRASVEADLAMNFNQMSGGMQSSQNAADTGITDVANGVIPTLGLIDSFSPKIVVTDLFLKDTSALQGLPRSKRIVYTNDVPLQNKVLDSIKALNLFSTADEGHVTDRFSLSDLGDSNTTLHNCSEYVYNKYFSYSVLKDRIISSDNMLDVVVFAYDPDFGSAAVGLEASKGSEGKGIVSKSRDEVYKDHAQLIGFSCINGILADRTKRLLTLAPTSLVKYEPVLIKDIEPTTPIVLIKDPTISLIKDPVTITDPVKTLDPLVVDVVLNDPVLIGEIPDIANMCFVKKHVFAGNTGVARNKNLFSEVISQFISSDDGTDMSYNPLDYNDIASADLDKTVNENWIYYKNRLDELPADFADSDFDAYRQLRIRLLDLLLLRARVEKSFVESHGVMIDIKEDDPYKKLITNANSYVGTLKLLTELTAITEDERTLIYTELSKPITTNDQFYNPFTPSRIYPDKSLIIGGGANDPSLIMKEVKPGAGSTVRIPTYLISTATDKSKRADTSISGLTYVFDQQLYTPAALAPVSIDFNFLGVLEPHLPPAIVSYVVDASVQGLLDQIDTELDDVIADINGYNSGECFAAADSACDWLPEQFVERIDGLVPDGLVNQAYEECTVFTEDHTFGELATYRFAVGATELAALAAVGGPSTSNAICNLMPDDVNNKDTTNKSDLSDRAYCNSLLYQHNYRANVKALTDFNQASEFFSSTAEALALYTLFKNQGISGLAVDTDRSKRKTNSEKGEDLFLGVSYSDFIEVGNKNLGMDVGYGIGAGVGGFQGIIDKIFATGSKEGSSPQGVDAYGDDEETDGEELGLLGIKASFFGHAYANLNILDIQAIREFDVFRITGFASSQPGFEGKTAEFMPAIAAQDTKRDAAYNAYPDQGEILAHAKKTIKSKQYFAELEILGKQLYILPENKSKRHADGHIVNYEDSYNKEYNLARKTIFFSIIPVLIEVDSGLSAGFIFHVPEPTPTQLTEVSLGPSAKVYLRFAAGLGFDIGVVAVSAGIEGFLDLLVYDMPLTLDIGAGTDSGEVNGVQVVLPKITYDNRFSYDIAFGSGKVGVYAKAKFGIGWFSYKKSYHKTLLDFSDKPLWHRGHDIFSLQGDYKLVSLFKGLGYSPD